MPAMETERIGNSSQEACRYLYGEKQDPQAEGLFRLNPREPQEIYEASLPHPDTAQADGNRRGKVD